MTVREQVLAAESPKAALLVLADAIDNLSSDDGWGSWDAEVLEATREQLDKPDDSWKNDGTLHDPGQAPPDFTSGVGQPTEGGPFTDQTNNGVTEFDFPLPTEIQKQYRKNTLEQLGFENLMAKDENGNEYRVFGMEGPTEDQLTDLYRAYFKAGPVWLYMSNREHVVNLPFAVRQQMVADVHDIDPKYAYDMGRDILMDRGEQDATSQPAINEIDQPA